MAHYLVYNINGKIIKYGSCTDGFEIDQAMSDEEYVLLEQFRENTYVNPSTSAVIDKSAMPSILNKSSVVANGVDEIIVSNLENPTDALVQKFLNNEYYNIEQYEVADGDFEISFEDEGSYKITLSSLHFLDKEYIVTATEA
jgi:hypothetical protein